ncbi:MAG: response regulator [Bacteriovoracaceae bacterium]|nr:response regulator [Bacteriovoracaceae bacterium]
MENLKRVLLVDNEPFFSEMFQMHILRTIYNVPLSFVTAKTVEEAMALMALKNFDLLVTDLNMADKQGLTLISLLETLPALYHPKKIIAMSDKEAVIHSQLPVQFVLKSSHLPTFSHIISQCLNPDSELLIAN